MGKFWRSESTLPCKQSLPAWWCWHSNISWGQWTRIAMWHFCSSRKIFDLLIHYPLCLSKRFPFARNVWSLYSKNQTRWNYWYVGQKIFHSSGPRLYASCQGNRVYRHNFHIYFWCLWRRVCSNIYVLRNVS